MRKIILTMATILVAIVCFGQYPLDMKYENTWVFGYGANQIPNVTGNSVIKFNTTYVDTEYTGGSAKYYLEGTSIGDTAGNLLLQCNGFAVYDSAFNKVPGADSLNCCNWVWLNNYNGGYPNIDGVTIVKRPGSENEFWVINKSVESAVAPVEHGISYALRISRVIQNSNGSFETAVRDSFVFEDSIEGIGTMELCRHANGRDWWLIQKNYYIHKWYIFLVDPIGIHLFQEISFTEYQPFTYAQAVFTPNGSKFIIAGTFAEINDSLLVTIYDFDRCTGTLSNPEFYSWKEPDGTVVSSGCAVSPNSRFLYVASTLKVFQFDLDAINWQATKTVVSVWDGFTDPLNGGGTTTFERMQLASDNRIYLVGGNTSYLNTIDNPDEAGTSCNVNQHSFKLSALNARTMPNFPNYRMGPIDGSDCDTLGIDMLSTQDLQKKLDNNIASINLYPNPASDYITLMIPRITKSWEFVIYNIQGKEVFRNKSRGAFRSYDVSFLSSGLYVWKLRYEDGRSENGKLVKE